MPIVSKRKSTNPPQSPLESMTLEETRSVLWLRNNHRPLGKLLDEGYLNRLPEELGNIWQGRKVDDSTRARIEEKLTLLCKQRKSGRQIDRPGKI